MRFPNPAAMYVTLTLLVLSSQATADVANGRDLSRSCAVCHGANGIGTAPNNPNLAGQTEFYLIKQMQDFRDGRRENEQMSIIAEGLTDEEIRSLAAWYSSIKVTVEMPAD